MKTKKRRVEYISFYNHTGLEDHFTKMAKKGWLIESISNFYWTYRKIEPKDLHFCVTYYPRASDFDPGPSEEQQTFHDFCAHTGWQLTCTWHQMQVFYNEKENPIPLETDPVLEVETLHKACKKNFLPNYFLLLVVGLLMTASNIWGLCVAPITILSNASRLLTGFAFLCLLILSITELTAYYTWYHKARKYAADGIFVDTPSTQKLQIGMVIALFVGVLLWLTDLSRADDPFLFWLAVVLLIATFGVILIVNAIKQGLKKAQASRGANKVITLIACFVLSFAITGGITAISIAINSAGLLDRDAIVNTEIPLSLSDLTDIDENQYMAENRTNQSVFVGEQVVHQHPHWDVMDTGGMPRLMYTVTFVKVPFLYDWCKNQLFNTATEGYQGEYIIEYLPVDAGPWGAVEAYRQLDESGEEKSSYLLCYEDRFVLIHFGWEPTAEQMAIVSEKLNP